jgi:predicted dehydrogenase
VLRYTTFFSTLHDIVASGRLGDIITVEHRENVAYWHMAHSYVRGNWRNSAASSPMILAKCCHDLDLLYWILGPVRQLSSVGSLLHFRPENAPPGAPERCTDGCPHESTCPWSALRLYMGLIPLLHVAQDSESLFERAGSTLALEYPKLAKWLRRVRVIDAALDYRGWPISTISEDTDPDVRRRALETGPYGRCVYYCDNDVVDHQVVSMQFESETSATLVMHGHSHREGRTLRFDGTRATLRGRFMTNRQEIEIHDHLTGKVEIIHPTVGQLRDSGHGGGDAGLMSAFVQAVRGQIPAQTTAHESLVSHLLAFAAEQARLEGRVVDMDAFRHQSEKEIP